eukprot:gene13216-9465_t
MSVARNSDLDDDRSNTSISEDLGGSESGGNNRKRANRGAEALQDDGDDKDDKPVLKPRDRAQANSVSVEIQAELDADMTVACLGPLHLQGLPESYLEVYPKIRRISTVPS